MAIRIRAFDNQKGLLALIGVLVFFLARVASAEEYGSVVGIGTSRPGDPPLSVFSTTTDLRLLPSVTSSTFGSYVSVLFLNVFCFNVLTGELAPGCTITVTPTAVFGTGGHNHDGTKPAGCFLRSGEHLTPCLSAETRPVVITRPVTDVTGSGGAYSVTYVAPEPSGEVTFTLTGTDPNGAPLIPTEATIRILLHGLEPLPPGDNYDLIGANSRHPDNHFGRPSLNASLVDLANRYSVEFPGQRLAYNDMSLVEGGLFDYNPQQNWRPPHSSHRFGTDVDLRLVPPGNRKRLRDLIRASGIGTILPEANHWHLRR